MKWFVMLLFGSVLLYCFYINGILAAISFIVSGIMLFDNFYNSRDDLKRYSYATAVLFLLSTVLTFYPVFLKPENKVILFPLAYADAIDNSQINFCPKLTGGKSNDYGQIKNEVIMSCSSQDKIDFIRLVKDIIVAKLSFISIEFSMASSLQAQNKSRNHCMECIEALIRVCPEEEKRFDKKSILALREAYKEYSTESNLCRVKERQ